MSAEAVIWHDLECGAYGADLPHWLALAAGRPGLVLDIGAGTGRVALALARAGHEVVALERDEELAAELSRRARRAQDRGPLRRRLRLHARAARRPRDRADADRPPARRPPGLPALRARRARAGGALLAVSLLGEGVEPFELELDADAVQLGSVRYESVPTALRREPGGAVLIERRRSRIAATGVPRSQLDLIRLERCDAATLTDEARAAGFAQAPGRSVAPTAEHAGSEIVCFEAPR